MRKLAIIILATLMTVGVQAITLKDVQLNATQDNTSLTFDRAVNTTNFTMQDTYVALNNFTFNQSEDFFINETNNVTQLDVLNWSTDVNVNSTNFINYFRFNNTDTGNLLSNWTFGNFTTQDDELEVFFTNYDTESIKNWVFDKFGLVKTTFSYNFTWETFNNITFQANQAQITVNIFNRETGNRITNESGENTTVTLVGKNGNQKTTDTGQVNFSSLNFGDEEYQVVAEHTGFTTESGYFDYSNQENVTVDLYLLNKSSSDAGSIKIIVKNELSEFVEGAKCVAQEWKPSKSAFVTVAQDKTNVNGEALLNIEIGTKVYKFECSRSGLTATTNQEIVETDLEERTLVLKEKEQETTGFLEGLTYTIDESFQNNVSNITFDYEDSKNEVTEACIKYYEVHGTSRTLLTESCAQSSDATIMESRKINRSDTVEAVITVEVNNDFTREIDSFTYLSEDFITDVLEEYNLAFVLPTILGLLAVGLGFIIGEVDLGIYLAIAGIWLSYTLAPGVISGTIATVLSGVLLLALWGGFTRK